MAWEIDEFRSQAGFSVRQTASSTIRGRFTAVRGYLHIDEETPEHSWIDIAIDARSLATSDAACDAHLRSKAALDIAEYPTITFKSVRVDHVVSREYKVSGNLTVRGVTNLVSFDAEFQDPGDANRAQRAALTARTTINCRDFGMPGPVPVAPGHVVVGEVVRIEIELALVPQQSGSLRPIA